jgi:hypothetical protein
MHANISTAWIATSPGTRERLVTSSRLAMMKRLQRLKLFSLAPLKLVPEVAVLESKETAVAPT